MFEPMAPSDTIFLKQYLDGALIKYTADLCILIQFEYQKYVIYHI